MRGSDKMFRKKTAVRPRGIAQRENTDTLFSTPTSGTTVCKRWSADATLPRCTRSSDGDGTMSWPEIAKRTSTRGSGRTLEVECLLVESANQSSQRLRREASACPSCQPRTLLRARRRSFVVLSSENGDRRWKPLGPSAPNSSDAPQRFGCDLVVIDRLTKHAFEEAHEPTSGWSEKPTGIRLGPRRRSTETGLLWPARVPCRQPKTKLSVTPSTRVPQPELTAQVCARGRAVLEPQADVRRIVDSADFGSTQSTAQQRGDRRDAPGRCASSLRSSLPS